eukprot:CAMPEP_0119356022 /NCGR_PEP_ID=MMETSP1334-20130426/4757_1 /TAXON_ID=127549 /ORGANISM="Calcidiscus leptoporus, Strain RCC1130" /LENGTH=402 /DNA_ID=CAMNT_0007369981 /DNA_START=59 /DNA_END=1267 /DNA_ORIENTATION=+
MAESSGSGLALQDSLRFAVALGQPCSQSLCLKNLTSRPLTFKIKTTNPKRYLVRPNVGVCWPHDDATVLIHIPPMSAMPTDVAKCRDKFQVLSLPLEAALAEELGPKSEDECRGPINDLWNSDNAKLAAVDKVRATLAFDWAVPSIPEEQPLSSVTGQLGEPAESARTPARSPLAPTASPPSVSSGIALGAVGTASVAVAPASATSSPQAEPAPPPPPNVCVTSNLANFASESAVPAVVPMPITEPAPAAYRIAAADETSLLGGSSAVMRALQDSTEQLRTALDESETARRAMRTQMERALAEYEQEKLEHDEQLRLVQAQLAAAREDGALKVDGAAKGSASQGSALSLYKVVAVAFIAMALGFSVRPAVAPTPTHPSSAMSTCVPRGESIALATNDEWIPT